MRRLHVLGFVVLMAACSDFIGPVRENVYPFRLLVGKAAGGVDTLTFHWPREMLPVRVWVAGNDSLAPHVTTALSRWTGVFLYGEFSATQVADSNTADIIVQNIVSPSESGVGIGAFAQQCQGETDFDTVTTAGTHTLKLPLHMYVWPNNNSSAAALRTCYSITVTHEFGHAIGILAHSPSDGDVMFGDPVQDGLSERDRETAEVVYHVLSTLTAVGRRSGP